MPSTPSANPELQCELLFERSHIPSLDGLRALAVGAVWIFHVEDLLPQGSAVRMLAARGWFGVELFFTLSGFLIGWLLIREQARNGAVALGRFYLRRFLRLGPAYLAVVAATTALLVVLGTAEQRDQAWRAVPYLLAYLTNFAAAAGIGFPLTLHAWSLAVEEQYYLLFPLVVRALTPKRLPLVIFILVSAIALVRAIGFFWWPFPWPQGGRLTTVVYYITPLRIDSILIGALAATLLPRRDALEWVKTNLLVGYRGWGLWALWLSLIIMFADERSTTLYVVWLPVLYVLSSLIILGLYLGLPLDLLRAFEHQWLTAVGRLSYSIYLVHVVCISLAARVAGWFAFGPTLNLTLTFTVALGLTALSSALLHRFVERPALRMKQRFAAT